MVLVFVGVEVWEHKPDYEDCSSCPVTAVMPRVAPGDGRDVSFDFPVYMYNKRKHG